MVWWRQHEGRSLIATPIERWCCVAPNLAPNSPLSSLVSTNSHNSPFMVSCTIWTEMQALCPRCTTLWSVIRTPPDDFDIFWFFPLSILLPHTWLWGGFCFHLGLLFIPTNPSVLTFPAAPLLSRPRLFSRLITFSSPARTYKWSCSCNIHSMIGSKCLIWDLYIVPNRYDWLKLFRKMFMTKIRA